MNIINIIKNISADELNEAFRACGQDVTSDPYSKIGQEFAGEILNTSFMQTQGQRLIKYFAEYPERLLTVGLVLGISVGLKLAVVKE